MREAAIAVDEQSRAASLHADLLISRRAEALTRTAIALALRGDSAALRMCLARLPRVPRPRPEPAAASAGAVPPDLTADLGDAMAALVDAAARGAVSAAQAAALARTMLAMLRPPSRRHYAPQPSTGAEEGDQ